MMSFETVFTRLRASRESLENVSRDSNARVKPSNELTVQSLTDRGQGFSVSDLAEILATVLVFFLVGSVLAPDVNEAHYWSKARHFWDPNFAPGDFFLESRDAHVAFFWSFGWLTRFFSLSTCAWLGRFAGWLLLATGLHQLIQSTVMRRGATLLASVLWVALIQLGQMSGEWLVGGSEAKVFAYGFVLLGWTAWVQRRPNATWIWLGVASAWHVLVGGWAVVMTAVAWLGWRDEQRPSWQEQWPGLLAGGLISLIGLIPAALLNAGLPPSTVDQAVHIYVVKRLSHHLMIRDFPSLFVLRHVLLIAVFVALFRLVRRQQPANRLWGVIWAATLMAIVGAAIDAFIGHTMLGQKLLRYYWFRATDIFVPLGVTIAALIYIASRWQTDPRAARLTLTAALILGVGNLGVTYQHVRASSLPAADQQGHELSEAEYAAWRNACEWIRTHIPNHAVFLTPPDHQTFKWYAERAELVTWKDVPQDAAGLVEWSERLRRVRRWLNTPDPELARTTFAELQADYPFDFILCRINAPVVMPELPVFYQNSHYRIFKNTPRATSTGVLEASKHLVDSAQSPRD